MAGWKPSVRSARHDAAATDASIIASINASIGEKGPFSALWLCQPLRWHTCQPIRKGLWYSV